MAKDNINWYIFCLWRVSKDFMKYEQSSVYYNGVVCDITFVNSSIIKEHVFNIHGCLMVQKNIKQCLILVKKHFSHY